MRSKHCPPISSLVLASLFFVAAPFPIFGEDAFEKIRDESPDKKFAMRIACDGTPEDEEKIDSSLITSITLVSLPDKKVVAKLLPDEDVGVTFEGLKLLWSSDSKWCAFYYAQPRIGYTSVFHRSGEEFVLGVKPDELRVPFPKNADVRNEYISPVKWTKPGELVLDQFGIFRGEEGGDSTCRFTAVFDSTGKKFKVTSKKKIKSAPDGD